MTALLDVRRLGIEFRTSDGVVAAVRDASFSIERGEITALVGESGCGKSATALAILRLIENPPGRIVHGEILFEGRDLLKMGPDEIRALRGDRIAMIFQEPMTSLNPVHTVGRQVAEPLTLHRGLGVKAALARGIALLASVNIADPTRRASAYPHQFSGGMRQRVMIAMAMGCGPDLVIADEPTTALDVTIQAQLLDLLSAQVETQRTALLLITHNLGVVARYANRIHVMYAGRIVESASADALFARPRHPYTIGLLHSVPRLDRPVSDKLVPIEGQPPDPLHLPRGCAFHPRCRFAIDACTEAVPPLRSVGDDHRIACIRDVDG
ncbi:ABC transporter ATP-binding protein [Lichenicoccus sp.]|uniref:ABC transporter ATP-binding protein n=1 Tax=Lichenicoccus sp. TaxID=2781899 RepID=UPI003D0CC1A2